MTAEIYIVSGFLGAGKTTLIQKLLSEAFGGERTAVIENDFGEAGIDASMLGSSGVEVRQMDSGCICCSLIGDFAKALEDLLTDYRPGRILIEPSGVGKLSDVVRACETPKVSALSRVAAKITVADASRFCKYLDNFGEFYEDQIENADVVILSRAEDPRAEDACRRIRNINGGAVILKKPWSRISPREILQRADYPAGETSRGGEEDHSHDHSADEVFDEVTIRTSRSFGEDELKSAVSEIERLFGADVLRAKGIVKGPNGHLNLQYVPGDLRITDCAAAGNAISVIGRGLDRDRLSSCFGER
ncbi:MAG: GTP-binding protein [Synergistaceae bacterium]|jgi:G3E family GTPase|nr:GTP-binding protein [Synergistaceae bacterium]